MVATAKSMFCLVLLALLLTSCVVSTAPQGDENYNIGMNFQSILRSILKAPIAKRSPTLPLPPPGPEPEKL